MDLENVPHVIAACCILHKVCEIHGDSFNEEWLQEVDLMDQPDKIMASQMPSRAANDLRTKLMIYFNRN